MDRPVPLTGLLIVAEGTIAEGATEEVVEYSMVGGDKEIAVDILMNTVGGVLICSALGVGSIEITDFLVTEASAFIDGDTAVSILPVD